MSLVKVSVENMDSSDKMLHEIDMTKPLDEAIKDICKLFGRPYSQTVYGLKLISTNDGKTLHTYITADNFSEIKDGYFLKLVFSLTHYAKRIFDHISDEYKERSFQDLYELSVDPAFIKELVRTQKHIVVMNVFTNDELSETECTACLIAIVHLFQKLYINEITDKFLAKVVTICKTGKDKELVKYALSVIHKILCHRDPNFANWKEEAIKQMPVADLMTYIKKQNGPDLQYGALLVINALIKCCKGDKRQQLIKEINQKSNRQTIFEHIISVGNVDKTVAHELYIYQTHLLSLYAETLTSAIHNDSDILLRDEFEIVDNEVKKMTLLMDFDESATKNKSVSLDNLIGCDDVRISLASMSSKHSEESRFSNRVRSTATNENMDYESVKPSLLTIEALRHYRQFHYKNYYQTQVEEEVYEPGILASSERVVRMLAKILHIGMEPDRTSTCYQPTIFTCSSRTPFFFELFSRTMWLLSKTRREMKASTLNDYEKVINVLAKQVKLALEEKATDFKKLTDKMVEITYETVVDIWQKEKQEELRNVLDFNPSVKVLRKHFSKQNEELIYEQRMNYVRNGTIFPKFIDKKINGNFKARLSTNGKELLINDYNVNTKISGEVKTYPLEDVKYIVEEKACPHVKNNSVRDPHVAFSIVITNDVWINFKAADQKSAKYWLDALNLLIGRENRSSYYIKELNELVEMDLILHLMELQNVTIPKKAPPVPRLPLETRPPIPPKPLTYSKQYVAQ